MRGRSPQPYPDLIKLPAVCSCAPALLCFVRAAVSDQGSYLPYMLHRVYYLKDRGGRSECLPYLSVEDVDVRVGLKRAPRILGQSIFFNIIQNIGRTTQVKVRDMASDSAILRLAHLDLALHLSLADNHPGDMASDSPCPRQAPEGCCRGL